MAKSKLLNLNLRDLVRGLITAIVAAIVAWLYAALQGGQSLFDINWVSIIEVAVSAIIGYLALNLGTNSKGKFLTPEE